MKVLELLDKLQDLVDTAAAVPFSNKIMIDPDAVLDLIDEIKMQLPNDLKDAMSIKQQESSIIEGAKKESSIMVEKAKQKMKELVSSDEITRNAYNRAQKLTKQAKEDALSLRVGSIVYSSAVLKDVQGKLREMINVLEQNKVELKELRKSAGNQNSSDLDI